MPFKKEHFPGVVSKLTVELKYNSIAISRRVGDTEKGSLQQGMITFPRERMEEICVNDVKETVRKLERWQLDIIESYFLAFLKNSILCKSSYLIHQFLRE